MKNKLISFIKKHSIKILMMTLLIFLLSSDYIYFALPLDTYVVLRYTLMFIFFAIIIYYIFKSLNKKLTEHFKDKLTLVKSLRIFTLTGLIISLSFLFVGVSGLASEASQNSVYQCFYLDDFGNVILEVPYDPCPKLNVISQTENDISLQLEDSIEFLVPENQAPLYYRGEDNIVGAYQLYYKNLIDIHITYDDNDRILEYEQRQTSVFKMLITDKDKAELDNRDIIFVKMSLLYRVENEFPVDTNNIRFTSNKYFSSNIQDNMYPDVHIDFEDALEHDFSLHQSLEKINTLTVTETKLNDFLVTYTNLSEKGDYTYQKELLLKEDEHHKQYFVTDDEYTIEDSTYNQSLTVSVDGSAITYQNSNLWKNSETYQPYSTIYILDKRVVTSSQGQETTTTHNLRNSPLHYYVSLDQIERVDDEMILVDYHRIYDQPYGYLIEKRHNGERNEHVHSIFLNNELLGGVSKNELEYLNYYDMMFPFYIYRETIYQEIAPFEYILIDKNKGS